MVERALVVEDAVSHASRDHDRRQGDGREMQRRSDAEREEQRRLLRERAPTLADQEHEAERVERIQRLRAKRGRS